MRKIFTVIGFLLLSFSIAACTGASSITFTFETNGGNTIEDMVVNSEDTSFELPTPVKEGYVFDGWYVNEELTDPFNFAVLLTATEITVYAKWTSGVVEYTITFETNGGSAVAAITLASGATVTAPTQPTKTGFTFGGWYSDSALTTAYTFSVMPAENITLYAKWNAVVVQTTITFEVNGGSVVAAITQNAGTVVVAPTAPTKTGYTFAGWYSDSSLATAYTFNLMPSTNLTLYAKWTINQYTISFEENGGSVVTDITQDYQSTVVAPTAPTKTGYTFGGWYSDSALTTTYTFNVMPSGGMTLYAKWTVNQYTISFEENGGSVVADITQDYLSDVAEPITPTKLGYSFDGWYSDALLTTAYTFTTMPLDGITLYAKWTATLYTISFEENGGAAVTDITQGYQTSVVAPTAPTKVGYTFAGWYSDALLTTAYTFTTMPMNNLTLYAKWTINQYTITFEVNGGTTLPNLTQDYNSAVSAPTPVKEGYTFVGWYSDALLTTTYVFNTMPASNITVYAKWEANSYIITFFDFINGYDAMTPIQAVAGQAISIPLPDDIVGYEFLGWFTDVQFDVPFIGTVMPAYSFTLYGEWEVSLYTITYNSNGGTAIDDASFTYFSEVPVPNAPEKAGYIFAGWYSDEALLTPFDFKDAPLADLTIYAKWILDEGFDPIQLILINQPTDQVTLRGVIYYKFPDSMNPGFYLYDGTGFIFVLSNAMGFNIGDGVEVVGYLGFFENTPQIEAVSSITPNGSFVTMPDAVEMPLDQLINASEYDINLYGQLVEITGVVGQFGPNFYLTALAADGNAIINYKSYLPMSNPFVTMVGQKVTIRAIIYDFNSHTYEWHIIYDSSQPIVQTPMTDQEKLDELILFAQTMLDHQEFYNGQAFEIPTNEPVYGALLSAETFGINAAFYDPTTGIFGTATEEIEIGVRITATLGTLSEFVDLTFILKPIDSLTVAEFILSPEMSYHQVSGVVIFAATQNDMQMMVIADATGTLAVVSNSFVSVGDYVIVAGYRMSQDGMAMMANQDPSITLIEIIEHGYPVPIDPIAVNVEQFLGLNANNLLYWLQYFEVTGRLVFDDMTRTFVLENELNSLPIFAFDQQAMEFLSGFEGFIVSVRGISLPNFDQQEPSLMLVFTGRKEDVILGYSDEDLVLELSTLLADYLSSPIYYPGQLIELPTEHPSISVTISYEAFGTNAGLINLLTGEISPTIESEVWIDLHVTITIGLISQITDVQLHVAPITVLTVTQFYNLNDYDFPYYVTGTVIFAQRDEMMYIIADESHIVFLMTQTSLNIGDLVVAYGFKMHEGGMTMLVGDSADTVIDVPMHDQPNPLLKTIISISDFILLDNMLPENIFKYFQMSGTLIENQEFRVFFLSDGENQIPIFAPSTSAYQALIPFSGMEVVISGLAMPSPDNPEEGSILVFINYPGDVVPDMTPEEFAAYVADSTVTKHLISTFRPGTTHLLKNAFPEFGLTIVYEVTGPNADKYNLATGWISTDITEELYIDITATSYLDGIVYATYNFQIHVSPEPILTVTEFYNLDDMDNEYKVEGTVIYVESKDGMILIADDQSIIMVMTTSAVNVGDFIQAQGFKMNSGGMIMLVGDPTLTLVEIISSGNDMPLVPQTLSYADFLALNPYDSANSMKYFEFIGVLHLDELNHMFYISDGVDNIPIITPKYIDYEFLLGFVNQDVKLKAISSNSGDSGQMMLVFINYPGDISQAYTQEEYIDLLASQLPLKYADMYFIPGQTYLFPTTVEQYDISFSYQLLGPNAAHYNLVTGLISDTITEEETIEVTITITGSSYSQEVVVLLNIIPPTLVTIQQFIDGLPGVLYQVQGIVMFSMPDDSEGACMISDGTTQLFILNPLPIYPGDEVILVGYQGDFGGLIAMGVDTKVVVADILSTGNVLPISPTPSSISDFNVMDMTDTSNWGQYIVVTGYIGTYYNEIENRVYLYLFEGFHFGDMIEIMIPGDTQMNQLSEYDGLEVNLTGFLLPYFSSDFSNPTPIFLFTGYLDSIETTYVTDQDKIDALIQLGAYHLEGAAFMPGDELMLPDAFPILGATVTWQIVTGPADTYDFVTGLFAEVGEVTILGFEATFTIGTTVVTHVFDVTVEPIPVSTVLEFMNLWSGDSARIIGVIIVVIDPDHAVLLDDTGMIIVEGFSGLTVGYEVAIYGQRYEVDGTVRMSGSSGGSYYVINEGVYPTIPLSDLSIQELDSYNGMMTPLAMQYINLQGRLLFSHQKDMYTISNGAQIIYIKETNPSARALLDMYANSDVEIRVYTYEYNYFKEDSGWSALFVGEDGEIGVFTPNNTQVVELLIVLADQTLSQLFDPNFTYQLPLTHPNYGGTLTYQLIGPNAIYATILGNELSFVTPAYSILVDVEVTAIYETASMTIQIQIAIQVGENPIGLAPGSLGVAPESLLSTAVADMFPGLYIEEVSRNNNMFGGTEVVVDMWFPLPSELNADYYILQYYDDVLGWTNFDYDSYTPLTTTYDNFSLTLNQGYTFRLLTSGVDGGELVSNSIVVPYTMIETTFTGWSLDMSMWITGVMYPYVGCGMIAGATVADMDYDVLVFDLLYQWYRVNPYTFAEEMIIGANSPEYTSTMDDIGYILKVKISGDEINVGGFVQVYSYDPIQLFNPGFVSNLTIDGFELNLGYAVTLDDLIANLFVYDENGYDVPILSITPTINSAIYLIEVDLEFENSIFIDVQANTWSLGSADDFGYHMPGLYISMPWIV